MAVIRPFRGIRYHTGIDLGSVITPPYDVIKAGEQDKFYQRSPYNIIRLEYGLTGTGDHAHDNRYTRAAADFQRWLDEGVLQREAENVFYVYEQSFVYQNAAFRRTGLAAALKAESYQRKSVLPHEETLPKPKSDRLELLRHCRANFSPIFGLFTDAKKEITAILAETKQSPPLFQFSEPDGTGHIFWAVEDPVRQEALIKLLEQRPVYIADGHHRYETALAYAEESDLQHCPGCGYLLAFLISLQDPGLIILPTHRLLIGLPQEKLPALLDIAQEKFEVSELGSSRDLDLSAFLAAVKDAGSSKPSLGLITPQRALLLRDLSGTETLDVTILQKRLLEPFLAHLGLFTWEDHLGYIKDEAEAFESVLSGNAQAAVFLNPTPMDELTARATRGEKMPQKSTYFYPKLPSGLVIHHLDLSY